MFIWCPNCRAWELARKEVRVEIDKANSHAIIETLCARCKTVLLREKVFVSQRAER